MSIPVVDMTSACSLVALDAVASYITLQVVLPSLSLGPGRWSLTLTLDELGTRVVRVCQNHGEGHPDAFDLAVFLHPRSVIREALAELIDWTPDPARLAGVSADVLAPFFSSPSEPVRVAALRALAFVQRGVAHGDQESSMSGALRQPT